MGRMVYLKNVVSLALDQEKCTGCGLCLAVCPHQLLSLENGRASISDRDRCMECGACAINCPSGSIIVQAGVGCATAVINSALGRQGAPCCALDAQGPSCCGESKNKNVACC
ncbi:MAG: 4Fe-4S binding protein [Deltaproteobacteria bacterium]|nr:4Fe-4S binding protein [Deltaproteobacteria bacterium]